MKQGTVIVLETLRVEGLIVETCLKEGRSPSYIISFLQEYCRNVFEKGTDGEAQLSAAWLRLLVERITENRSLDLEFRKEFRSLAAAFMSNSEDLVENLIYASLKAQISNPDLSPKEGMIQGVRKLLLYSFPAMGDEARDILVEVISKTSDKVSEKRIDEATGQILTETILETLNDIFAPAKKG